MPTPNKSKPEKTQKKKRKKKNRLVRELVGDEEGSMNLDDSTGQTPSAILSGMTYLQHHHHHPSEKIIIHLTVLALFGAWIIIIHMRF
jgi:hypothetical protein